MRAKYAEAIRYGIMAGRRTRYGDADDPYYEERSKIIWSGWELRELVLKAFEHTWETETATRKEGMTPEEWVQARENFNKAWELHTESREERQTRLLREEIKALKNRVYALEDRNDI